MLVHDTRGARPAEEADDDWTPPKEVVALGAIITPLEPCPARRAAFFPGRAATAPTAVTAPTAQVYGKRVSYQLAQGRREMEKCGPASGPRAAGR